MAQHSDKRPWSRIWVSGVAISVVLTGVLVLGVYLWLDKVREQAALDGAMRLAEEWSHHMQRHTRDMETLIATGIPDARQAEAIAMAANFDGVMRFSLFDTGGRLVFVSDSAVDTVPAEPGQDFVQRVLDTGRTSIEFRQSLEHDGHLHRIAKAYMPLWSDDGAIIGVVRLLTDQEEADSALLNTIGMITVILPLICAVIFLGPTLVLIRYAGKARDKDLEVRRLSLCDPLTGLLNRGGLSQRMEALFAAPDADARPIGLLFVDIDNFKRVNDSFGHNFGDMVLRHVSSVLRDQAGPQAIIGRLGGDEFVLVIPQISAEELQRIAGTILDVARNPVTLGGNSHTGSVSIGLHVARDGEDMEQALHAADLALYHAKDSGRARATLYFEDLDKANERGKLIERNLRRAHAEDAFEIHYQPFVDVASGRIAGFEALLRLRDEDGRPIGPDEFIPVAERTGLIHDIGLQTLRRAIATAQTWPEGLYISVNISAIQFQREDLAQRIGEVVRASGIAPSRIELELTESLLLSGEDGAAEKLELLRALGLRIAMDDFGTGYSGLGYLWRYPFDKIKVDRSFLQGDRLEPGHNKDIIETIILLGRKLGMRVTVEGVETAHQAEVLCQMHCDELQGYLFARPMPATETLPFIARHGGTSGDLRLTG